MMQKITPHLWFDKEAVEAAKFYASVFPQSKVTKIYTIRNTPSGDCDTVSFEIWGFSFMAISAGPLFKLNPSISFIVNFDPSRTENAPALIDEVWGKLNDGGKIMMPIGKYPFSARYGWIEDKYGVSWQLILADPAGEPRPNIVPALMFTGKNAGKAEEAIAFYTSIFKNGKRGMIARYERGMEPDKEGTIMYADFMLENQWFAAMDSARVSDVFTEAVSLMVNCESQEEIDYYWQKMSAEPDFEQCGWLKDKYGVSWQIIPQALDSMLSNGSPEQVQRVTQAFLKMKKFDVAKLEKAFGQVKND